MVKTRFALIGTFLAFTTLLTAIPMAAAYEYYPILIVNKNASKWEFSTLDPFGNEMFSSKDIDVSTVEAYYLIGNDWYPIEVKKVHLGNNEVTVNVDKDSLPAEADGTKVIGALYSGETFMATGPGFVWRKWG